MRRSAVLGVLLTMLVAAAPAAATPGVLDPSFGSGGVFLGTTFATQYDDQQVVAVDAQGRALVAITEDSGQMQHYTDSRLWVARLTAAGALDPTFAPGAATPGLEPIDLGAAIDPGDWVTAAAIRPGPGGSIVVLAAVDGSNGARIGLVRLDGAGGYDTSFHGTGRLVTSLSPVGYSPNPMALLVDDSGRMVVSGAESYINHNNQGFVARFTAAGALDSSFAGTGLFVDPGSTASGQPSVQYRDLAFAPGGGIVAAGDRDLDAAALKLTAAGAPDPGFGGGDGLATTDFAKPATTDIATGFGIGIDSQSRVVLSGQVTIGGNGDGTVVRFTPAGALDGSWGSGTHGPGIVWLPSSQMVRASGVAISSGDRVVLSGQGFYDPDGAGPYGDTNAPSIARLTAAGALDPAFGSGGVTMTGLGSYANGYRLAADPVHQRLLVPGSRTLPSPPFDVRPFVLAYGDDGSADAPPPSSGTPTPAAPAPAPATPAAPVAPAGTVVPAPTVKPPAPKPAALTLAQAVSFPPTKTCASRRRFGIRLRVPKGVAVKDATVSLNGKRVAVRKGNRLRSTVNLVHLPKGTFTVSIQIRLADGHVLKGSRKYHTCAAKRHGGKPKV